MFMCARSGDDVKHTSKELRRTVSTSTALACDVTSTEDVDAARRSRGRALRPDRRPGEQRRTQRRRGHGPALRRALARRDQHQPEQRLPRHPRGAERRRHAGARHGRIINIASTGGKQGVVLGAPVLGLQARRRRLHQGPRQGARPDRRSPSTRSAPATSRRPWPSGSGRATPRPGTPPRKRSSSSSWRRSRSAATPPRTRSPDWSATWLSDSAASVTAQALNVCGGLGNF